MKPAAGSSSSCCVVLQKMATHFVGFFFCFHRFRGRSLPPSALHHRRLLRWLSFCLFLFDRNRFDPFFLPFSFGQTTIDWLRTEFRFFSTFFLFNGVLALSLFYFVRHFRRSRCFARGFGTWTRERERERPTTSSPKMMASSAHLSFFLFFLSLSHSIPSSIQFSTSIVVAKRNTFIVRVFFNWLSLSRVVRRESRQKKKGTKPEEIDESTAIADWSRPLKRPINVPTLRATRQNPVTPNS